MEEKENKRASKSMETSSVVNCLRKEILIIRYIPRETSMVTNPNHVLYGGMAEQSERIFTVPILASSGTFVNVLTNDEKICLEGAMGLDPGALSVYAKVNNYWMNYSVRLTRTDTLLDLSIPEDYIKYKVLLANKDFIASSPSDLKDHPKATYQFVITSEKTEMKNADADLSYTMRAYELIGKYEDDKDVLKFIVESMDGRPISSETKLEYIKASAHKLIKVNAKLFVKVAEDPMLPTKVFIERCVQYKIIRKSGDFYYVAADSTPMGRANVDPVLSVAAEYLNEPKNQELKFTLEAKLKQVQE